MFGLAIDQNSPLNSYISYMWFILQVPIGLVLNRLISSQLSKMSSITTLVILPLAPVLSLTLFVLKRVETREYYDGFIFLPALVGMIIVCKMLGAPIIVFSVMTTVIIYSCNIKQDGIGPVIVGVIICWLCKDIPNPITVIISANIICSYITRRIIGLTTNKFKVSKEGYDNNGTSWTVIAGFLEAAFIGAPSDVISNNKDMMNGLSDVLCVINLLINDSTRGSSTVVVTNIPTAIIFFMLLAFIYVYNTELPTQIKECDKVWPPVYSTTVKDVTNLELGLVVASLIVNISNNSMGEYYIILGKLVIVILLFFFVRIKVCTSLFFSTNLLF